MLFFFPWSSYFLQNPVEAPWIFPFPFWILTLSGTFWQPPLIIMVHEYGTFHFHSCIRANQQKICFLPPKATTSAVNVTLSPAVQPVPAPGLVSQGLFPCCLRDNLSWHLLLGVYLLLTGDNFSVFMSQTLQPSSDTPTRGKRQCRTHKTYPVLAQLELAALGWGKRGDDSRQELHCKYTYISSNKVVSQALMPLRYPKN